MVMVANAPKVAYGLTVQDLALIRRLGLPNKIIGQHFGISDAAVSMKITRLAIKLGVENRTAIIIRALRLGLVKAAELSYREFHGKANLSGTAN